MQRPGYSPLPSSLSVRWHRLDFIGRHPLLGLLEVRLAGPHHSQGIIRSLAAEGVEIPELFRTAMARVPAPIRTEIPASKPAEGFFPAFNQNEIYFAISVPRLGAVFHASEPVRNASIVWQVPPVGSTYVLMNRPTFDQISGPVQLPSITVEECILTMSKLLDALGVRPVRIRRGPHGTTIVDVELINRSHEPTLSVAVLVTSNAGVFCRQAVRWVRVQRKPLLLSVALDHSKVFTDVGTASLSFFVTAPLPAHGFRNVVMDVREVREAQFIDNLPRVDECAA